MEQSAQPVLKVLVADDHPLILHGLRRTLEACDDIDVVGEARTGDEVVPLVERRRPDVVLLDMRMPGLDSAECIRLITASQPDVKTIVLSASEDRATIDSAVRGRRQRVRAEERERAGHPLAGAAGRRRLHALPQPRRARRPKRQGP